MVIILKVLFYCEAVPPGQCSVVLRYSVWYILKRQKSVYHADIYLIYWEYRSFYIHIWVFLCLQLIKYTGVCGKMQTTVFLLTMQIGNAMKMLENPEPKMHPFLQLMGAENTKMPPLSQLFPLVLRKWLVREETLTNYSQHAGMLSAEPGTWANPDLSGMNTLCYITTPSHLWLDLKVN